MKKNDIYVFLVLSLSLLVPVAGRLAYGIVILLAFNFFVIAGTSMRKIVVLTRLQELQHVITIISVFSSAVLFKQILVFYSPVIALNLGFVIYVAAACAFMVSKIYVKNFEGLKIELKRNLFESSVFSLFGIVFFLFRDIIGYGTISFPVPSGVFELELIKTSKTTFGVFFASIPGALIMVAVSLLSVSFVYEKFKLIKRVED